MCHVAGDKIRWSEVEMHATGRTQCKGCVSGTGMSHACVSQTHIRHGTHSDDLLGDVHCQLHAWLIYFGSALVLVLAQCVNVCSELNKPARTDGPEM